MKVERESLHSTRLWCRELFYLEKESEPELPFFSFAEMKCKDLPVGWTRVSPHRYPVPVVDGWRYRLAHELIKSAWTSDVLTDSFAEKRWMDACDTGTDIYGVGLVNRRIGKLMGLTRSELWAYTYLRRNENVFGRCRFTRGSGVLKPTCRQQYLALPWHDEKLDVRFEFDYRLVVTVGSGAFSLEVPPPSCLIS